MRGLMWWLLLVPRALLACQKCVQYFTQLRRACMAWQVRHFRVVNTGAQAVVCSLAAPLPESSGFALAPGRFTLPPAPPNGDLPSVEATATLLVSFCALQTFLWLQQVLLGCTFLTLMATSMICPYCDPDFMATSSEKLMDSRTLLLIFWNSQGLAGMPIPILTGV